MPSSYQPPTRKDKASVATFSQSTQTNTALATATVRKILEHKGSDTFSIRPAQTLGDAVILLKERRIGALLVCDADGRLAGILSERDIVRKLADTPGQTLPKLVADVMTRNVVTCTPEEPLVSILQRMSDGRFRHMPVLDENELVGMVTIGDVVNYRLTELEHEALQLKQLIVG